MINFTNASFILTEDCNLACDYCFELPRTSKIAMSTEVAEASVNFLISEARRTRTTSVGVTAFGGEPLLNFPALLRSAQVMSKSVSSGLLESASLHIITNATILTQEMKDYFINSASVTPGVSITVQLSIDGKSSHDVHRKYPNGKGSLSIIEALLPEWKRCISDVEKLSVHSCYTSETIHNLYSDFLYFYNRYGLLEQWPFPIHGDLAYTAEHVRIYEEQLLKVSEFLVNEYQKTQDKRIILGFAPLNRYLNGPSQFSSKLCGAGSSYCSISPTGDIYPCHNIYFNDKTSPKITKLGNIYEGVDSFRTKFYEDYDNRDTNCYKEAPECDAYSCYRCPADNLTINGSFLTCIRGGRCAMSHVEKRIGLAQKQRLIDLNLYKNLENSRDNRRFDPENCPVH